MKRYKAIPPGYMTVGEIAKKMSTTVRTLQYYDKEGLLSPSAESEGGRRLYTDKDVIRLHQIQSMKYLGFTLDDIKNRLMVLDTPEGVAAVLTEQANVIQAKIISLSEVLHAIEKLRSETMRMQTVDFKKYADIVINLQMKNEFYGLIKHFNDDVLDHIRSRFDKESGAALISTMDRLCEDSLMLQKSGIPPESEQGQALGKQWWEMVTAFTGGDMNLLPSLMKFSGDKGGISGRLNKKWAAAGDYVEKALEAYFADLGINPFEEAKP